MKNTLTFILIISLLSCKAQQIIIPLAGPEDYQNNPNYYLKDADNDFNKFEGTWKYQNGNTEFIIELQKKEYINDNNGGYIYDLLIGEYKYTLDNIMIVNTLPLMSDSSIIGFGHYISGNTIIGKNSWPICTDCNILERRVSVIISNPANTDAMGRLTLRYVNDNGVEKIEAHIQDNSIGYFEGMSEPPSLDMHSGNYVFIKQ